MSKSKKLLTAAIAAVALAAGTLAPTTAEASPRGFRGFNHGFKWQGYRWQHSKFYYGNYGYGCYFVYKPWGKVKICPWY